MAANGAATLPEARPFLAAAEGPAGDYTLKVAALDGRGRRGSVEHRVKAGLPTASGIEISDLLLSIPGESQELRARIAPETDGQLVAAVEIYAREATPLARARAALEGAEEPKGPARGIAPTPSPPGRSGRGRASTWRLHCPRLALGRRSSRPDLPAPLPRASASRLRGGNGGAPPTHARPRAGTRAAALRSHGGSAAGRGRVLPGPARDPGRPAHHPGRPGGARSPRPWPPRRRAG